MKIISLIASATEIIHSLGLTDNLVGISHECDYPKKIKTLPVCSKPRFDIDGKSIEIDNNIKSLLHEALSIYNIDTNLLLKLKPDIIITQSQCDVCGVTLHDVENALKNQIGINPKIISLNPSNLEDVWNDIKIIATNLEVKQKGAELLQKIQSDIDIFRVEKHKMKSVSVACIEWIEPLMYAGNWVPELVHLAGGNDLFGIEGKHSSWAKYETLFKKNPDKIILMPCGYDIRKTYQEIKPLESKPEWSKLRAVKTNNVFITDGNQYFNRPGPRLLDSFKILIEIINNNDSIFGYRGNGWVTLGDLSFTD